MQVELHDSFDAEWEESNLYRELIVTTSPQSFSIVKYNRPQHSAVMIIGPDYEHAESAIRQVLGAVSQGGHQKRYEKLILVEDSSESPKSMVAINWILRVIHIEFFVLVKQRRVFFAVVDSGHKEDVELMRAVCSARCVECSDGGVEGPGSG